MVHHIALWFTEAPQENSVSIRLIDASGSLVETGDVERDVEDEVEFTAAVGGHVMAGDYTVSWRAMGSDGHVVRGDFAFSVLAH